MRFALTHVLRENSAAKVHEQQQPSRSRLVRSREGQLCCRFWLRCDVLKESQIQARTCTAAACTVARSRLWILAGAKTSYVETSVWYVVDSDWYVLNYGSCTLLLMMETYLGCLSNQARDKEGRTSDNTSGTSDNTSCTYSCSTRILTVRMTYSRWCQSHCARASSLVLFEVLFNLIEILSSIIAI